MHALQHDLAGERASGVQQIVCQARHVCDLTRDDGFGAYSHGGIRARIVQQAAGVADCAQRVAEFMTQHGEELVFGTVGPLGDRSCVLRVVQEFVALGLSSCPLGGGEYQCVSDVADLLERCRGWPDGLAPAKRLSRLS